MIFRFSILALAALCGCGDTVSVGNGNPSGTVGGMVVDAAGEMPLAGVDVKIISASATIDAMSDANGVWQAKGVPAGTFIISFTQMGYVTATFQSALPGAVGNLPVSNPMVTLGPIGLLSSAGTFDVRVVDEGGAPVPMVKLVARPQVRYVDFSSAAPVAMGAYEVDATTDTSGLAQIGGLPDYASLGQVVSDLLLIDVAATKVMGTEQYSFLGGTFPFNVNHLTDPSPTITLAGPQTPLAVLQSNIDYVKTMTIGASASEIGANGPITVAFNQAIDPASVRASFVDSDGKPSSVMAMTNVTTNLLSITPQPAFTPGARYNLQLHAVAAAAVQSGNEVNVTAPFFAQQPSPPAVVSAQIDNSLPQTTAVIKLNRAVGVGHMSLNPLDCVAFYEGVLLDNGNVPYPGEWNNGDPTKQTCNYNGNPPVAGLDVTRIVPVENPPFTGFTDTWRLQFSSPVASNAGCSSALGMAPCQGVPIMSGTKVHLLFSKQAPSTSVRFPNGDAVPDTLAFSIGM